MSSIITEHVKMYDRLIFQLPRKETVCCLLLYYIIYKFRYESLQWISQGIIKNRCPPSFQEHYTRIYYLYAYGNYVYAYLSSTTCSIICPPFTAVSLSIHNGNTKRDGFTNTETRHRLMPAYLLPSPHNTSAYSK